MIKPYIIESDCVANSLSEDCEYGVETRAYSDNLGNIFVVTADEYELMYRAVDGCPTDSIILKSLHIATRKEIKAAGLWDYVINKEDYSSEEDKIETELDEYLRIGEELSKAREAEEK